MVVFSVSFARKIEIGVLDFSVDVSSNILN